MPRAVSIYLPNWPVTLAKRRFARRQRAAPPECAVDGRKRSTERRKSAADGRKCPAFLLVATERGVETVAACCAQAAARGVRRGISVEHARALLSAGNIVVEEWTPARDAEALRTLARWALRFSPVVAVDDPDGVLLDIAGCEHLFGGEEGLLAQLASGLQRIGLPARIAAAATGGCAAAVARYGSAARTDSACAGESPPRGSPARGPNIPRLADLPRAAYGRRSAATEAGAEIRADVRIISRIPRGGERAALAPLPVAALRVDERTRGALEEVNLHFIGELFGLPRKELAARFGAELLHALDAALGDGFEQFESIQPAAPLIEAREFDGAVTCWAPVAHTVRELLEDLLARVRPRGCGLRGIEIELRCVDRSRIRVPLTLTYPSQDAAHIWSLLSPKLERAKVGFGVERIAVGVLHADELASTQMTLWHDPAAAQLGGARELGELLDRLADRLGAGAVQGVELRESYVPERAFALRAALSAGSAPSKRQTPPKPRATPTEQDMPTQRPSAWRPAVAARPVQQAASERCYTTNRPSRLFAPPEPARVIALVPDGPPMRIEWRGDAALIRAARGPQRLAGPWWEAAPPAQRDYFEAQLESGRMLWLFRERETGQWFVQGEWA